MCDTVSSCAHRSSPVGGLVARNAGNSSSLRYEGGNMKCGDLLEGARHAEGSSGKISAWRSSHSPAQQPAGREGPRSEKKPSGGRGSLAKSKERLNSWYVSMDV